MLVRGKGIIVMRDVFGTVYGTFEANNARLGERQRREDESIFLTDCHGKEQGEEKSCSLA